MKMLTYITFIFSCDRTLVVNLQQRVADVHPGHRPVSRLYRSLGGISRLRCSRSGVRVRLRLTS